MQTTESISFNCSSTIPSNALVIISHVVDDQLLSTLASVEASSAYIRFTVFIKLGPSCSPADIDFLLHYLTGKLLRGFLILSDDSGIYNAMNQATSFASQHCSGYCWFVNAGDLCLQGISTISDYLSSPCPSYSPLIICSSIVSSPLSPTAVLFSYFYRSKLISYFKPPIHNACLFPYQFWSSQFFPEQYTVSADIDYIYKSLNLLPVLSFSSAAIATFFLGGTSSSSRSFAKSMHMFSDKLKVNLSNLPFWIIPFVSFYDFFRIFIRSWHPRA